MRYVTVAALMGLGGSATSSGVLETVRQINALGKGYRAKVFSWSDWEKAGEMLKTAKEGGCAVVALGYSNGGSKVTDLAALGFPLDLLISEDPTVWLQMHPLQGNVREAICFHNVNPASSFPPVGHAALTVGEDWDPERQKLTTIDTWDAHTEVDKDHIIQAVVLAAVKKLGQ